AAAIPAESSPTIENGLWTVGTDGTMETTITIRRGAPWHDGPPITSADLTFAIQLSKDPNLAMFGSTGTKIIESTTLVDERTVIVHWKQPFIEADRLFGQDYALPLPRHILEP